ncbi:hypothetical protein [Caulobacter sp. DWP3-1-3b2]|uniref:hypothetical protein n=1 Tax=Caulobacter sp. DWP3-1-3b2 TaxID=2804643 RepID=UPI003CE6D1C3
MMNAPRRRDALAVGGGREGHGQINAQANGVVIHVVLMRLASGIGGAGGIVDRRVVAMVMVIPDIAGGLGRMMSGVVGHLEGLRRRLTGERQRDRHTQHGDPPARLPKQRQAHADGDAPGAFLMQDAQGRIRVVDPPRARWAPHAAALSSACDWRTMT